jgi:hypothetical protein
MRNSLLLGGIAGLAIGVGVLIFLYGGDVFNTPSSAAVSVPFEELTQGTHSSVLTRTNYLITSAEQLNELWKMTDANGTPPIIDFNESYVAAVFAGQEPTAGYKIAVSKIEDGSARTVAIMLTEPSDTCVLAEVETTPYQIVVFQKTPLPLTHVYQTATGTCGES